MTTYITAQELKEKALKKGYEVSEEYQNHLGIKLTPYNWFWWEIREPIIAFDSDIVLIKENVHFTHSYSQRTGKTQKNFSRWEIAERKLLLS